MLIYPPPQTTIYASSTRALNLHFPSQTCTTRCHPEGYITFPTSAAKHRTIVKLAGSSSILRCNDLTLGSAPIGLIASSVPSGRLAATTRLTSAPIGRDHRTRCRHVLVLDSAMAEVIHFWPIEKRLIVCYLDGTVTALMPRFVRDLPLA